jgi:hypothetical protein
MLLKAKRRQAVCLPALAVALLLFVYAALAEELIQCNVAPLEIPNENPDASLNVNQNGPTGMPPLEVILDAAVVVRDKLCTDARPCTDRVLAAPRICDEPVTVSPCTLRDERLVSPTIPSVD